MEVQLYGIVQCKVQCFICFFRVCVWGGGEGRGGGNTILTVKIRKYIVDSEVITLFTLEYFTIIIMIISVLMITSVSPIVTPFFLSLSLSLVFFPGHGMMLVSWCFEPSQLQRITSGLSVECHI